MCLNGYTDPVFSNGTKYKNFYCAVCNRVDQSHISCGQAIGARTNKQPESDDKNNLSFSLLLDINFSEGNVVGKRLAEEANCMKGEVFDPFARRCRNIVCGIPGYVLQNGLCVADGEPRLL
ncbi:SMB domain-containing protein [Caerostris extrusa]|nr:SMB domain-containing protein [Caerostris extrusa]